jgi:hypothetical protein
MNDNVFKEVLNAAKLAQAAGESGSVHRLYVALAQFRAIPGLAEMVSAMIEHIEEIARLDNLGPGDLRTILHAYVEAFRPVSVSTGARPGMRPGQQVVVFAAVVNSDSNEGRGRDVDIGYFWSMEDAREFVRKKDVMGTDGKVVTRDAIIASDGQIWLGHPIEVRGPTSADRDRARARLRAALTPEQMDLLGIPESAR